MDISLNGAKKVTVMIYGKTYEIDKPKMSHQLALESALKAAEKHGSSVLEPMVEYVVSLGLPKEVVLDLDSDDFTSFIEKLSQTKKK